MSKPIIHFMQFGHTACLINGPPKDWPDGHRWSSDWKHVTCPVCRAGRQLISTFRVSDDGGSITCLRCLFTSPNTNDVENHYCSRCGVFHDDLWPPCRKAWIESGGALRAELASTPRFNCSARTPGLGLAMLFDVSRREAEMFKSLMEFLGATNIEIEKLDDPAERV